MPKSKRQPFQFLDDAIDTFVDTAVDRVAEVAVQMRSRALERQKAALSPDYKIFQCAACKREFDVEQMEQLHPINGWGTCKNCYQFMFRAAVEKLRDLSKKTAKAAARGARGASAGPGFQPPPPPSGPVPWEVLGVTPDVSMEDLKRAYRKQAALYHPDRVAPGAPDGEREQAAEMFRAIQRAYQAMVKVRMAPE